MKITKLILHGYKRLMLNNIKTFTYTPENTYQLILGTNGSGKSSILHELSPLPGFSGDYIKGGYKHIEIEHAGNAYVLRSEFKSGNKHFFTKNGTEDLNPGNTGAVQKEMVEREFKITPDIHKFLIGKSNFTAMSPAKRREWITKICETDFTYALGVYQQLKSSARDAQGALKHNKQRVTSETHKLQALSDVENLEERYQSLHKELEHLFSERDRNVPQYAETERQFNSVMERVERLSSQVLETFPIIPQGRSYASLEAVEEDLNRLTTEIKVNESLRNRIASEYDELNGLIRNMKENGTDDIEALQRKYESQKQERDVLYRDIQHFPELVGHPMEVQRTFFETSAQLMQVLQNLPPNPTRKFTRQSMQDAKEALPNASQETERCQNRLAQWEGRLEHLMGLKDTECPKCLHRWVPGLSDQEKEKLERGIAQGKEKLALLRQREREIRNFIEEAEEYSHQYGALRQLVSHYPKLQTLWDAILNNDALMIDPKSLTELINRFSRDLDKHVRMQEVTDQIERLEKIFSDTQSVGQVEGIRQRIATIARNMEEVTELLVQLRDEYQLVNRYYQKVKAYLGEYEELENQLTRLEELREALVSSLRSSELEGVIREHQTQLGVLQSKRTEKQSIEGILKDLERHQVELELDHETHLLLANALSPTDGLIAEQLTGFIENYIAHINNVIGSVWTYELKVKPCGLDGADLDYKFPIHVRSEGETNTPPDISEGSEAQVEIINFAFRLVTMVYLGLEEYPVYLDEIGSSFDEQHRQNVMSFIKRLVDTGNYTQLFLVSHYAAQYGSFTQAEILVLDGNNITIPKAHNQHVILE